MKKYIYILIAIALRHSISNADITWRPLWDGTEDPFLDNKKFPGFVIMGDVGAWKLDDDAIYGELNGGPYTMVWSEDVYTDAVYQISYKVTQGNSGAHIRARPDGTNPDDVESGRDLETGGTSAIGLHAEVDHRDAGCLYCSNCGGWKAHAAAEVPYNSLDDPGDWIDLRFIMNGTSIKTFIKQSSWPEDQWMEGVTYDVGTDADMQKGRFGMQMHGGQTVKVWFKNHAIAGGCTDSTSPNYDQAEVEAGWVLEDNGTCGPGEIEGCTDIRYAEYNPEATVSVQDSCISACKDDRYAEYVPEAPRHSQEMCQTVPVMIPAPGRGMIFGDLVISIGEPGAHRVRVHDVNGEPVFTGKGTGETVYRLDELKPGIYFVQVKTAFLDVIRRVPVY